MGEEAADPEVRQRRNRSLKGPERGVADYFSLTMGYFSLFKGGWNTKEERSKIFYRK